MGLPSPRKRLTANMRPQHIILLTLSMLLAAFTAQARNTPLPADSLPEAHFVPATPETAIYLDRHKRAWTRFGVIPGDSARIASQKATKKLVSKTPTYNDSVYIIDNHPHGRFRWGADAGSTIDCTGQDLSSLDISISFGFSRKWINFLGVGAKALFNVGGESSRSFPLFVNFRTNFKNTPSVVFWDIKGGVALNYFGNEPAHTGIYASTGVGFYLARSSKFSSHILVGYTFRELKSSWTPEGIQPLKDFHGASVRIGVMF